MQTIFTLKPLIKTDKNKINATKLKDSHIRCQEYLYQSLLLA